MPRGIKGTGPNAKPPAQNSLAGIIRQIEVIDGKLAAMQRQGAELVKERTELRKAIDLELKRRDRAFSGEVAAVAPIETTERPADNAWTARRLRQLMQDSGLDATAIAARVSTDPIVVASWAQGEGPFYPLKNSIAVLEELERKLRPIPETVS